MDDQTQSFADLPAEVAALRARVAELETLETEHRRSEQVQSALYRIADAASAATDMPEFYTAMHSIVGELMFANHFFIALYDDARQMVSFPFHRDDIDTEGWPAAHVWLPIGAEKTRGMTGYVLRTGQPALIIAETYAEPIRQGEIEPVGVPPVDWLGVPLKTEGRTLGVVAVQSYREDIRYTEQDKALLSFVAQHIATALSRARAIEETRQRNAELAIVNEVGQALASELEMDALIQLTGEQVRQTFVADVAASRQRQSRTGGSLPTDLGDDTGRDQQPARSVVARPAANTQSRQCDRGRFRSRSAARDLSGRG